MPTNSDSSSQNTPRPTFQGSFRLFRLAGVDVFVHWAWLIAAIILIQDRPVKYSTMTWDIVEYVAGFGIVLIHEFGHVFACRSVGGTANRILLWPLGGLAFVVAPPRPGANLWTTVAGPLVNVFLAPVLFGLVLATAPSAEGEAASDFHQLFWALAWFNIVILVFNLLPIYPLDGGRILHALLWFVLGPGAGLAIAAAIGLVASIGLLVFAVFLKEWWLALTSVFLLISAYGGLKQARALIAWSRIERRTDLACPHCHSEPPIGAFWKCAQCKFSVDPFESSGSCPNCNLHIADIPCLDCGKTATLEAWGFEEPPPSAGPHPRQG
jgi:Zn-dependent protease